MNAVVERTTPSRRIAVFVGNYVDVVDGVAMSIRRLVAHLLERGDQVRVFAPAGPSPAYPAGSELHPVPALPLLGFAQDGYRYAHRLDAQTRQALEAFDPEVIHIASPDRAASQAIEWARDKGKPVVGSFHTNFASYFRFLRGWSWLEPIAWRFQCGFYDRMDLVNIPTQSMLDTLRSRGLRAPARIWARGVELERFSPQHRDLDWRRARGIGDEEVVIAFVARLFWEKGVRKLASVLQALEARGVRHRVLIAGEGPARSFLERELPEAIFTGFITGRELSTAYASADIFFYPSETDTFGNVTLEAMASGLPVVAADAPGSRCVVEAPAVGSLISPKRETEMMDALFELASNEVTRRRKSVAARAHANRFEWSRCLEAMRQSYETVIAGDPSRPKTPARSSRAGAPPTPARRAS